MMQLNVFTFVLPATVSVQFFSITHLARYDFESGLVNPESNSISDKYRSLFITNLWTHKKGRLMSTGLPSIQLLDLKSNNSLDHTSVEFTSCPVIVTWEVFILLIHIFGF